MTERKSLIQTGGMTQQPVLNLSFDLADRLVKSLRASRTGVAEMAEYLGVSRATVANWTSGRTVPTIGAQRAWAMRAGVPYEWLHQGVLDADDSKGGELKKESFLSESNRRPSHYKVKDLRYGEKLARKQLLIIGRVTAAVCMFVQGHDLAHV